MIILSLFDGKSSGYTACELAGVPVTRYYSSEVDKYAIKVSDSIHPDQTRLGDVTKWREWDVPWWDIDLIIAGSPCQGFSLSGKQLAFDDPRSKLFFEFVDILNHIKFFNSKVKFMLENVKMKRDHLDVITGYLGVEPHFINSSLVSAQNRQRYYWCNWSVPQPEDRKIFLRDVLEYDAVDVTYMSDKFVNRNRNAGCLRDDLSGKAKSLSAMEYVKNGRQGDYINVDRDKSYSLTSSYANGVDPKQYFEQKRKQLVFLQTNPAAMVGRRINPDTGKREDYNESLPKQQYLEVHEHGKSRCISTVGKDTLVTDLPKGRYLASDVKYRKLTPRECFRLQTTPEHYIDKILACGVSNTQLYKIAGNGWNDETIAHIFRHMR